MDHSNDDKFDKTIRRPTSRTETRESSKKITEEDLTCQQCQRLYKRPRMLQCLHVFCTSCLITNLYDKSGAYSFIVCHICNAQTKLPESGLLGLPVDMVFSPMVDKDGDFDETPCTCCKMLDKAVAQCNNCDMFLCPFCVNAHETMEKMFSWHKVSTICNSSIILVGPISSKTPNLNKKI